MDRERATLTALAESELGTETRSKPWLQEKIDRARQINTAIGRVTNEKLNPKERGAAWDEALLIGSSDPKRVRQARSVFSHSLETFHSRGEDAVVNIQAMEVRELSKANFDMANDVAQGYISREAGLVISKLHAAELSEDQVYELASAFVARAPDERLEDFDRRRRQSIDQLKQVSGLSEQQTWTLKRGMEDVLQVYSLLESAAIDIDKWPKRQDGQIRRSFINRSEALNVAVNVVKDVHACNNLEARTQQIEQGAEIPRQIQRLEELVEFVEDRDDVRGATFDMFDTLVQWTSSDKERHDLMWKAASGIFSEHKISITPEEFKSIRNPIWEGEKRPKWSQGLEFQAGETLQSVVREVARRKGVSLKPEQIIALSDKLERAFIAVDADTAVPMPGAIDALRGLREKGIKIGVVSNHPFRTRSVEDLLQRHGLLKYIDQVVVSSEAGHIKTSGDPNATIFRIALDRLGLPPESVIHTGDNPDADQNAPERIGMKGVVYNNPFATQKTIQHLRLDPNSREYKEASLSSQREFSRMNARSYFEANRTEFTPPELEAHALRLYEISRDIYAPVLIKFAQENLDNLAKDPDSLNLAVGRDGLAIFLMQRKLIQFFPERYGNVDPQNVQFVNLSRKATLESDPILMRKFLEKTGFFKKARVSILDSGIAGTIQDHLQNLFPEKDIKGNYLMSRKFRDDKNKNKKTGFMVVSDSERDRDLKYEPGRAGTDPRLIRVFFSSDFVHNQEDMWNGIFESAAPLQVSGEEVKPANAYKKMNYVPGNRDVLPGLNDGANYLLLKKMALKGITDAVHMYRRQTQLGMDYSSATAVNNLANWFTEANKDSSPDNILIRGLVRKRK